MSSINVLNMRSVFSSLSARRKKEQRSEEHTS